MSNIRCNIIVDFCTQTAISNFYIGSRTTEFNFWLGNQTTVLNFGSGSQTTEYEFWFGNQTTVLSSRTIALTS